MITVMLPMVGSAQATQGHDPVEYASPRSLSCYKSLESKTPRLRKPGTCVVLTNSGGLLGREKLTGMRWSSWGTTAMGEGKARALGGWHTRTQPVKVYLRGSVIAVRPNGAEVVVYTRIKIKYTSANLAAHWLPILN